MSFAEYQVKFMKLFIECLKNGLDTNSARDYCELELKGKLFHDPNRT